MHGSPALAEGAPAFPYTNPDAPKGGRLVQAITGSFDSLNPLIVKGVAAVGVRELVYESLMKRSLDEPFTLYGLLAEWADMPQDRSRITFRLQDGARFSDRTPVTVDDVIFSWRTLRAKGWPYHRQYYSKVLRVERPGKRMVTFVFDPKSADRELPLILGLMPILSKRDFTRRPFDATSLTPPIGSGPYRITAADPGRSVTYTRDPDYWGRSLWVNRGSDNFDTLRYDYYRDSAAARAAVMSGNADVWIEPDATQWMTAYTGHAIASGAVLRDAIPHHRASGLYGLVFNTRRPPFDRLAVRRALATMFDFKAVNRMLLHSAYVRTQGLFDGSDLAPPAPAAPYRFANDRARRRAALSELAQAGYTIKNGRAVSASTGAPLRFEIILDDPTELKLALVYAAELKTIGVEADVRRLDSSEYQGRIRAYDFDMTPFHYDGTLSPGNEQYYRWGSASADTEGSYNLAGVKDPRVDAALAALLAAQSREDLRTAARALDALIMKGAYVVPLFHVQEDWIVHSARLARPERTPLTGADILTWWVRR